MTTKFSVPRIKISCGGCQGDGCLFTSNSKGIVSSKYLKVGQMIKCYHRPKLVFYSPNYTFNLQQSTPLQWHTDHCYSATFFQTLLAVRTTKAQSLVVRWDNRMNILQRLPLIAQIHYVVVFSFIYPTLLNTTNV